MIAIEPAPDYSEGQIYRGQGIDEFGNIRGPQPFLVNPGVNGSPASACTMKLETTRPSRGRMRGP